METPIGLGGYPITKFNMISTVAVPLIAAVSNLKYLFLAQYDPFILEYNQYYRYILFQYGCVNESDVILLVLIWYNFRHLERLFGSQKYLDVISLIWLYTTSIIAGLNIIMNTLLPKEGLGHIWNRLPSGPLPITLALFHFYKQYTPKIYQFQILLFAPPKLWGKGHNNSSLGASQGDGESPNRKRIMLTLTDQFLVDALIVLLVLNQGLVGILCAFISWIIGIFIEKGLFPGMSSWKLPLIGWLLNERYQPLHMRFPTGDENALLQQDELARNELDTGSSIHMRTNNANDNTSRANGYLLRATTTLQFNDNNNVRMGSNNQFDDNEDQANDEPVRPLRQQFLDVFRR